MMLCYLILFISFFIVSLSSFHSLILMLTIEFFLLLGIFFFISFSFNWFTFLIIILFGVCLGGLGVSLLVSSSRSKGFGYFISFF